MISIGRLSTLAVWAGLATAVAWAPKAVAQTVTVKVASTSKAVFDNLPFFVGDQAGLFKKHGLEVELTHFRGGGEVVRAVSSGSMDIGMVATTAAIIAAGRGQAIKIISGWSAPAFGIMWIVPTKLPIKSISEIGGKKAGVSRPGSVSHTGLLAALQANGLKGKVEIVPVGGPGDSWAALKSGRVQVSWFPAPEVYKVVDRGDARILFDVSKYLTEYQQGSLVAMSDYLAKSGETARKFLAAAREAMAFIDKNPAQAAKMGAKAAGYSEKMELETIRAMPKGFFRIGAPEAKHFKGSMAEAIATRALKKAPAYDAVVDKRFLP